jgi:sugar phosphate isomerase/epimerase
MNRRGFLLSGLAPALGAAALDRSVVGANTAMAGYGLDQAIDALRRLGFPTIEIHPMGVPDPTPGKFPGFEFDRLAEAGRRRIRQALEGFRHITAHLPYIGLDPFSQERPVAESSSRIIGTAMEAAAFFGAELAVLHVIAPKGRLIEEAWPSMIRQIRAWGDFAAGRRFKLAIETGFPASVVDFVRLIKEVAHDAVGCTIDVGHQSRYKDLLARVQPEERATPAGMRAYNDVTHAIIDGLREKVFHFHVHDIDPQTWREHRPLGTGFVDYPRLIAKLRRIDYRGVLVLEIAGPGAEIEALLAGSKRQLEAFL